MGLYVLYVRENYFVVTLVRAEEMLARPKARQLYPPMGHACALELLPVFFYRTYKSREAASRKNEKVYP